MSRAFGADRGEPVDRHYIEEFLASHAGDVQGRVLEFGQPVYSRRYGARDIAADVADPDPNHPEATVTLDLTGDATGTTRRYDCIICTQVLLLIYDIRHALRRLHELLTPGGVLLLTVPGISQVCKPDVDLWGDYWRFSSSLMRQLLEEVFAADRVQVESRGNLLSATAFLYGLAQHEVRPRDLEYRDSRYTVTIAARAVKPLPNHRV